MAFATDLIRDVLAAWERSLEVSLILLNLSSGGVTCLKSSIAPTLPLLPKLTALPMWTTFGLLVLLKTYFTKSLLLSQKKRRRKEKKKKSLQVPNVINIIIQHQWTINTIRP